MIHHLPSLFLLSACLSLVPVSGAATFNWDPGFEESASGGGDGTWDAGTGNWFDGAADRGWGNSSADTAVFSGAPGTVSISGALTANALNFTTSGYTISGGTIILDGVTPTITGGATITSVLAGTVGLTKAGAGALTLSGANTYSGVTGLGAGSLILGSDAALGLSKLSISGAATLQGSGARSIANAVDIGNAFTITGGATDSLELAGTVTVAGASRTLTNSSSGAFTLSGTVNLTDGTAHTFTIAGAGDTTISGLIQNGGATGALSKTGAGELNLSYSANTYTGITTIGSGATVRVVKLSDGGQASSIGAATAGAGNLVISGTLIYAGTTASSTNRRFQIGTTAATIVNEATDLTATLRFTDNANALTFSGSNAARALTLGGSNAGDNLLAPILNNNGTGVVSLTKIGAGRWIVSGANSYSGGTTVSAGTLVTGNAGALGVGDVTVAATGVLEIGSGTATGVTLGSGANLVINGTLRLSSASSTVTLTDSGSYTFNGKLDLNGLFEGVTGTQQFVLIAGDPAHRGFPDTAVSITGYDDTLHSVAFSQGVLTVTTVPEPAVYGLIGAGLAAAGSHLRRRRMLSGV